MWDGLPAWSCVLQGRMPVSVGGIVRSTGYNDHDDRGANDYYGHKYDDGSADHHHHHHNDDTGPGCHFDRVIDRG